MYYNKAIIIGHTTRDPELKQLPSGSNVASLSIATNRVWKDTNGQKKEQTDFHNILVFGKQADSVAQFVKKGALLMVEGRIQTRSWEDTEGKKHYRTEIVAERVTFGPRTSGKDSNVSEGGNVTKSPEKGQDAPNQAGKRTIGNTGMEYPDDNINAEDIPF